MRQLAIVAAILLAAQTAHAQALEQFEYRQLVVEQEGKGYQSLAGPVGGPGDEHLVVVEPLFFAKLRSTPTLTHDIAMEVDIVSAASPDAIDATTSASHYNEALTMDVHHRWRPDKDGELDVHWGLHVEEPLRSEVMGLGYTRKFAEDNFTLNATALYAYDNFDHYGPYGDRNGTIKRQLANANLSVSQVLSPTTILDLAYGYTYQRGSLETPWNAVPGDDGKTKREEVPNTRHRHAATVRVSQFLPRTHTAAKISYRLYHDDFGLDAHTVQLWLYQYLTPWLYGRAGWRVHAQDGADFYTEQVAVPAMGPVTGNRTSDSDLAPFVSNEVTLKVALLAARAPFATFGRSTLDATIGYYTRSNDLRLIWGALAFGYDF